MSIYITGYGYGFTNRSAICVLNENNKKKKFAQSHFIKTILKIFFFIRPIPVLGMLYSFKRSIAVAFCANIES